MKKSRGADFWKIITFIVIVLLVLGIAFLFSDYNDPNNLVPNSNSLSGNVILDQNPLTTAELVAGVSLDSRWNVFIWNNDLTENLAPATALASILENVEYVYSYNEGTFYFNPNGNYASYTTHSYYGALPLTEIEPGHKYGVFLKTSDTLSYGEESNDPAELLIILPDGTQIDPATGEIVTIFNNQMNIVTFDDAMNEAINSDNPITIEGATCSDADIDQSRLSLGRIDFGDFGFFADCFGRTEADAGCIAENFGKLDFDNDGYIGQLDLGFFGSCFAQRSCSVSGPRTQESCEAEPEGVWLW